METIITDWTEFYRSRVNSERYPNSIHYVPLDKYEVPSYGDERLLPYEFWLDMLKPKEWALFNDGHDLTFRI